MTTLEDRQKAYKFFISLSEDPEERGILSVNIPSSIQKWIDDGKTLPKSFKFLERVATLISEIKTETAKELSKELKVI